MRPGMEVHPVIPAIQRLREKDCKFEASPGKTQTTQTNKSTN
jgi:hypothetical protein